MTAKQTFLLNDRALLRVAGDDAATFLQNLVTVDIRRADGGLAYGCLLTAQGQFLHEFFIFAESGGYILDCDAAGRDELLRRLGTYKLRSKVTLAAVEGRAVSAGAVEGLQDPRLPELGRRAYGAAQGGAGYDDLCISLGVPPARAMRAAKDYMSDLNLDLLGAVSFDKGCFVGQELTARMHHRGLVKRRLLIVEGAELAAGDRVLQDGVDMGEVRVASGMHGLALLKLHALKGGAVTAKGEVKIHNPVYMLPKS